MFRLPDNNPVVEVNALKQSTIGKIMESHVLFSNVQPSGISILWPSLATTKGTRNQLHDGGKITQLTDYGPSECDISTEVNIASHGQVIKLKNLRDLLDPFLELLDLGMHEHEIPKTKVQRL
jgi:hypothetical protein